MLTPHPHKGCKFTNFEPCKSIGLACSLKKIKRGANSVHVPSTCNVHHVIFTHSVVMPLPRCANALSLVSPAQKFTNSEDPIFKISPSLARAACAAYHWLPQRILSPYGGHQPTKFESDPSAGWPAALKNKKRSKFLARAQHVQCASQVKFPSSVVMATSRWANVPSLVSLAQKFTNSEDLTFKKLYPSGTCRLCS